MEDRKGRFTMTTRRENETDLRRSSTFPLEGIYGCVVVKHGDSRNTWQILATIITCATALVCTWESPSSGRLNKTWIIYDISPLRNAKCLIQWNSAIIAMEINCMKTLPTMRNVELWLRCMTILNCFYFKVKIAFSTWSWCLCIQ